MLVVLIMMMADFMPVTVMAVLATCTSNSSVNKTLKLSLKERRCL